MRLALVTIMITLMITIAVPLDVVRERGKGLAQRGVLLEVVRERGTSIAVADSGGRWEGGRVLVALREPST